MKILEFTWEHRDNFSLLDSYHGILAEFFFLKLTFFMPQGARSKTRKPRKSRKFFLEIFESEFSILAVGQNRKLGNKKTRNNISEISEVSEFSICHFFIFQKTFFFSIFYSRQFRTFYLRYVLFSRPLKVFFPSPKIYVQNITLS